MLKNFKCSKCGKIFKTRYTYDKHIFKVGVPCNYKVINTKNGKELVNIPNLNQPMVMENKNQPKKIKINYDMVKSFIIEKNKDGRKLYECKFCGNEMVYPKNAISHFEKKWCKVANPITDAWHLLVSESEKNEVIKKNKQSMSHMMENNVYINITNNIVNNNNINVFSGIKLNPFGKENLDILTDDFMDKIIENPNIGIIKLIKHIHFNPAVPENRNIVLKNKKNFYIDVFNGSFWEKQDKGVAIHNLISSKKDIMDDHFELMNEQHYIEDFISNTYNEFSNLLEKELMDNIEKDIIKTIGCKTILDDDNDILKGITKSILLVMLNDKEVASIKQA